MAFDDTNNNRAFLSQTISATNNGASIYIEAKRKPETYKTEKGTPMWQDIQHARIPKGPAGQFNAPGPQTHMLGPAQEVLRRLLVLGIAHHTPSRSTTNGSSRSRATPAVPPGSGRSTRYGTSTRR